MVPSPIFARGAPGPRRLRRIALAAAVVAAAACGTAWAATKSLSLDVVNGSVAGVPANTISVQRGDDVRLQWTGDKPMELHLHGYDIEIRVEPGKPATMAFKATIPGRFSIEQHGQAKGHHGALVYLEVQP